MALINPPAWLQQGSYPAKTDRQVIESIVHTEGVVSGFVVTQTPTASMSVNISAGKAFIAGTSVALQGMYNVINDAPSSVSISGSNTSNPRYDLIVITVNDADVSGTANSAEFRVIAGVPSSNPQVPSIPPSTLVLARVFVGAGVPTITTAAITDVRIYTAPKGGIVSVPDTAARLRLSPPPAGDMLYVSELNTGNIWKMKGNSWSPVTGETFVCTSSTRPTGVPLGFTIFESDTGKTATYTGPLRGWIYSTDDVRMPFGALRASQGSTTITLRDIPIRIPSWPDGTEGAMTAEGAAPGSLYLRPNVAGLYRFDMSLLGAGGVAGYFQGNAVINNGTVDVHRTPIVRMPFGPGQNGSYVHGSTFARLSATDRVYMDVIMSAGDGNSCYLQGNSSTPGFNSSSETKMVVSWVGP